ncbi:MAG: hypothetical protein IJ727_09815 [Treponema sp.]|nr:hypothetical protein [Treponema sp.]
MDCWKILGIEPTEDKTEIKRAFAKKVKENPPDADAKIYQSIREAYNQAMSGNYFFASRDEGEDDGSFDEDDESDWEQEEPDENSESGDFDEDSEESEQDDEDFGDSFLDDEGLEPEERPESNVNIEEISRIRENMRYENARSLSDIAGYFTVNNWYFSETAEESFLLRFIFFMHIPAFIAAIVILLVWVVSK